MLSLGFGHRTNPVLEECLNNRVEDENKSFYFFTDTKNNLQAKLLHFASQSPTNSLICTETLSLEDPKYFDNLSINSKCSIFPSAKFKLDNFQLTRLETEANKFDSFITGWNAWNRKGNWEYEETFYKMFEKYDSLRLFSILFGESHDSGFGLSCLQQFLLDEYPKNETFSLLLNNEECNFDTALCLAYAGMNSTQTLCNNWKYWNQNIFSMLHDKNARVGYNRCQSNVIECFDNSIKSIDIDTLQNHYAQFKSANKQSYIGSITFNRTNTDEHDDLVMGAINWYENQLSYVETDRFN